MADMNNSNQNLALWVFAKPNQLVGHKFNDSVAITYASNKDEALANFNRLYNNVTEQDVTQVVFNSYGISILTDY